MMPRPLIHEIVKRKLCETQQETINRYRVSDSLALMIQSSEEFLKYR